jgi:hypothetical protein
MLNEDGRRFATPAIRSKVIAEAGRVSGFVICAILNFRRKQMPVVCNV